MSQKTIQYEKLSLHDQILLRPDTYVGSVKHIPTSEPIYTFNGDFSTGMMQKQICSFSDALLRIFIEVLSNSIDNVWRSSKEKITPRFINIDIDVKTGFFSVWNDGKNIPTTEHPTEKVRIPEMIFGQLLTSSNYNDSEERKTSGRNGYGVKLCNIFSKQFQVQVYNVAEQVLYLQLWENNMKTRHPPVLSHRNFPTTIENGKNGFTCITWKPDYERFGYPKGLDSEIMGQIKKCILDIALTVSFYKVQVNYNKKLVPIVKIEDYVKFYRPSLSLASDDNDDENDEDDVENENDDEPGEKISKNDEYMVLSSEDSKVYISSAEDWTQISFVNGIFTKDGGTHVDAWSEAIFRPILTKLNSSKKKDKIDIRDVKKYFFLFVFSSLDKPSFDNQSKTKLNGPQIKAELTPAQIKKILKWSFVKKIEESLKLKEMLTLKKNTERKKGKNRIEGLDDAKYAGKKPESCYLCISEGMSAKTYIIQGMKYGIQGKNGRDWIGVIPIRGKFLNTRNASASQLANNKEVVALIQTIGLQYGLDYTIVENRKKLRYHKILVCTDADVDGFHITGLLYNFFHSLFPTILKMPGFFNFMRVPIVKISYKSKELSFFYQDQANDYINQNNIKKDYIRYFKGLGTANNTDVKEDFGRRIVQLNYDDKTDSMMTYIFDKNYAEYRKKWLTAYKPRTDFPVIKDYSVESENITDFLNLELINFSLDDCKRSLPSMLDGFKESYRKILFSAFKRNLKHDGRSLKVAQFAGYIAENSNYHHGEVNLFETITKMAQRYVGSNNIPLLCNEGQFGTRLVSGKDAANGRYIFTKLEKIARLIFREEDDSYLPDRIDDGDIVEKEFYLPIIPTILVNPTAAGIGTGWSCNVPAYNPKDLISWIKVWLQLKYTGKGEYPVIKPWYRGFKGLVEVQGSVITTYGVLSKVKQGIYRITEIPIGRKMYSIQKYKEKLEDLIDSGVIKEIVSDDHTDEIIDFTIKCDNEPDHLSLGLVDTLTTTNMVCFNSSGKLVKYNTVEEILEEYCGMRLSFYTIRKQGEIKRLQHNINIIFNKIKFISSILTQKINLLTMGDSDLENYLINNNYYKNNESYEYLLSIQVRTMTKSKLDSLQKEHVSQLKNLEVYKNISEQQMWMTECHELEAKL